MLQLYAKHLRLIQFVCQQPERNYRHLISQILYPRAFSSNNTNEKGHYVEQALSIDWGIPPTLVKGVRRHEQLSFAPAQVRKFHSSSPFSRRRHKSLGDDAVSEAEASHFKSHKGILIFLRGEDGGDLGQMTLGDAEKLLQKDYKDRKLFQVKSSSSSKDLAMYRIIRKPPKETTMTLSSKIDHADLVTKVNTILMKSVLKGNIVTVKVLQKKGGPELTTFIAQLQDVCQSEHPDHLLTFKDKPGGGFMVKLETKKL